MKIALPASLFALSACLAVAIAYELAAPLEPVGIDAPRTPVLRGDGPQAPAYAPPSIDQFADIDARPVFNPTRKPLADVGSAASASGSPSDLSLVGVMISADRSVALLKSKTTSITTSVAVGDIMNGWRVVRIDPTKVSLRGAGGMVDVPLATPGSQSPSAPLPAVTQTTLSPAMAATSAPVAPASQLPAAVAAAAAPKPVAAGSATMSATSPKPALPVRPGDGSIAAEALKGAPRDPRTGEPTL